MTDTGLAHHKMLQLSLALTEPSHARIDLWGVWFTRLLIGPRSSNNQAQHWLPSSTHSMMLPIKSVLHQRRSWSRFSWTEIKSWTKITLNYVAPSWTRISWSRSVQRPWLYRGRLWLVNHARPMGQLQWRHSHTQCLRNSPVQIGRNLFKFEVTTQFLHQSCSNKVPKISILCSNRYSLIILWLLSRYNIYRSYSIATAHQYCRMLSVYPLINLSSKKTTENRYSTNVTYLDHKCNWI